MDRSLEEHHDDLTHVVEEYPVEAQFQGPVSLLDPLDEIRDSTGTNIGEAVMSISGEKRNAFDARQPGSISSTIFHRALISGRTLSALDSAHELTSACSASRTAR